MFGAGSRSGIPVLPFRLREKASFSLAEFSLGQVKAKPLIDLGFRTRNANRSPEAGLCLAVPVCLGTRKFRLFPSSAKMQVHSPIRLTERYSAFAQGDSV